MALKLKHVIASTLITKRRYWSMYVNGDDIKAQLQDLDVGITRRLRGELQ